MKHVVPFAAAFLSIASLASAAAQELLDGPLWPVPGVVGELGTADMNCDGRPDILLAATAPHRVGYLPSLGFGRFGAPVLVDSPGASSTPSAGDFTSDGIPDLITTDHGAVRVHPCAADGTLGAPITTPIAGTQGRSQCAVDLDLDDKLDVVLDATGGGVIYLLGDGTGGFGAQVDLSLGAGSTYHVATGHLDNDPWPDIVCTRRDSPSAGISVFTSDGPARFAAPVHYSVSSTPVDGLDVGDFTGDGLADVAFTQLSVVHLYANAGNGTLTPLPPIGPSGSKTSVQIADMDEDGLADLVFGAGAGMVRIAQGTGGGAFASGASFFLGSQGLGVLVLDVDSDGHLDVARTSDGISIVYGDGTGALGCARDLGMFSLALEQGHLDHDGYADLIVTDGGAIRVLLQRPGGGFAPPIDYPTNGTWDVAVGFLDADFQLDVLASGTDGKVSARMGDGLGGLGAPIATQLQAPSKTIAVADLDGDGLGDLVAMPEIGSAPSVVHVRLGTGNGTFGVARVFDVAPFASDPEIADIDQDGDLDLAFAQGPGMHDTLLSNDGTGQFTKTLVATGAHTHDLRLIDVSGDGIVDLLGAGYATAIRLGTGGGSFAAPVIHQGQALHLDAGDVTGDGIFDLVSSVGLLSVTVRPGLGGGAFGPASEYHTQGRWGFELLDTDLDGRLDVILSGDRTLLHLARGQHVDPLVYCTAKANSLGCVPSIGWSGVSSASSANGFTVRATQVRNRKAGILLYGVSGRDHTRFSGGSLCVRLPVDSTPALTTGGSPSGNDCTGVYAIDMNAFAAGALGGNPIPALSIPGTAVACQFWGRDPGFPAPNNTTLSDALEYLVEM